LAGQAYFIASGPFVRKLSTKLSTESVSNFKKLFDLTELYCAQYDFTQYSSVKYDYYEFWQR